MEKKIYDFYCNKENADKIKPFLYDREFAFLFPEHLKHMHRYGGYRFMKIEENDYLNWAFQWAGQYREKDPVNLYCSVAKVSHPSLMKWKRQENREFKKQWRDNWFDWMYAYDFVVDIDAPSHEEIDIAKKDTLEIVSFLNKKLGKIGQIRFSGRGFHIYYYYETMNSLFPSYSFYQADDKNIYDLYRSIAVEAQEKISDLVDVSVYDPFRLIKVPCTLVFYHGCCYYSSILSLDKLRRFDLKKYEVIL